MDADWKLFAEPEEIESARKELATLSESLHRAELCVTILKGHAMQWNKRMLEAVQKAEQAKKREIDAMAQLQETCQKALEKHGPKDFRNTVGEEG